MFRSNFLAVLVIAGASVVCAGLLLRQFRVTPPPNIHLTKEERMAGDEMRGRAASGGALSKITAEAMSLEEFRVLVEEGEVVIVDARPEVFHRLGHVPGALSLPVKDFQASYAKHRGRLEADKGALVVIYCSGDACEDSTIVRKALERQGHTRLVIFKGGWDAWTGAGFPVERAP